MWCVTCISDTPVWQFDLIDTNHDGVLDRAEWDLQPIYSGQILQEAEQRCAQACMFLT